MRTLLYLDGENLHWSLMHHHSRELDLGVVLHLAAVEVYEARLYADFSRFPREIATRALALGVDSVHVPSHPNGHSDGKWKSTTDQRLTLDCLERILTGPPWMQWYWQPVMAITSIWCISSGVSGSK